MRGKRKEKITGMEMSLRRKGLRLCTTTVCRCACVREKEREREKEKKKTQSDTEAKTTSEVTLTKVFMWNGPDFDLKGLFLLQSSSDSSVVLQDIVRC